ncbi:MAG: metabolite traffic protein EboE [Microcoleaceae cyanobacterium MO_207.B10]|nr:metabolite traffic protein EboE [Microcoleaceae cyanobacterium MO_207.B10]
MKIGNQGGFHLTYCSNIHPGEDWQSVNQNLKQYIPSLKAKLAPDAAFGIGLRLADVASRELLQENNLAEFQTWLEENNLYVFTLNGFPYGGFHRQIVKDQVYAPDWSKPERLDYTLRLVNILATLLPEGIDGGISTVPLSYKPWWKDNSAGRETVLKKSCLHLAEVVKNLVEIRQNTGKLIHIDLEPEPDGLIENATEVIDFYQKYLIPIASKYLIENFGVSQELAEKQILEHISICYDTCHFAVEYENPKTVLAEFAAVGIKVGKIQLSAAIKVKVPDDIPQRQKILERLQPFAESTYLHQVIARNNDGSLQSYRDLMTALPAFEKTKAQEWRTHFHVPIFIQNYQLLESTQADIIDVLKLLQEDNFCTHLEIETYTWDILPGEMKLDILASIQREYDWVLYHF